MLAWINGCAVLLRTPRDIGSALRHQRRRLGLDQADVARRVGVSRKWVIDAEKGSPGAGIGLILRAFTALGTGLALADAETSSDAIPPVDAPDIDEVVDDHRRDGVQPPPFR